MKKSDGPYFVLDKVQKARVAELRAFYVAKADRMQLLMQKIKRGSAASKQNQAVRHEIYRQVAKLDEFALNWSRQAIPESAGIARNVMAAILGRPIPEAKDVAAATKMQTMVDGTSELLLRANHSVTETFERWVRISQQTVVEDKVFTDLAIEARLQGASKSELTADIYSAMQEQLGGQKFVTINGRDYNLADYSELVATTRMTESATTASIDTALAAGIDLVEFSTHAGACELCQAIEGQIFSLSGNDPEYPALTEEQTPPIHPRCCHRLLAVGSGALEEDVA